MKKKLAGLLVALSLGFVWFSNTALAVYSWDYDAHTPQENSRHVTESNAAVIVVVLICIVALGVWAWRKVKQIDHNEDMEEDIRKIKEGKLKFGENGERFEDTDETE